MNRTQVFTFSGFSGLDVLRYLLPESWQARYVARSIYGKWSAESLETTIVAVRMPKRMYRVVWRGIGYFHFQSAGIDVRPVTAEEKQKVVETSGMVR